MIIACPRCGRILPASDTNIAKDTAVCSGCNNIFRLSDILDTHPSSPVDLDTPPKGAWFQQSPDGFETGATTRSFIAFFMVPFMTVWSAGALGGLYGTQIANRHFSVGMTFFGLPFLAGAILFWAVTLMAVNGKCVVTVKGNDAMLFTGIGPLGWRRRFRWNEVRNISEAPSTRRGPSGLHIEGRTRMSFASQLSEERRYFVLQVLRSRLSYAESSGEGPYRTP